ncbi:hypothetical protein JYJ95_38055 [Corallococcus exiguus]|uniref:hypothetical protein n=1 Tax=Corallococcus exiguus TaxID=83462 RepID=UPI0017FFDCFF|nr:hypothetical protein [Corallococcus exiguus]MBN8472342.1 hypothetical protein [Corallococcus exiguus]NNB91282.1 hypothetical protein [Corallococcus exiguus]
MVASVMMLTQLAETVMPIAKTVFEARAKLMGAQPDLDTLREKNAHERAMANQQLSWAFYTARDKMVGRLMIAWTAALVLLISGGVFAIQQKVIDQQSALTLGLFVAGAMGWAGSRFTGRTQPPSGPSGP